MDLVTLIVDVVIALWVVAVLMGVVRAINSRTPRLEPLPEQLRSASRWAGTALPRTSLTTRNGRSARLTRWWYRCWMLAATRSITRICRVRCSVPAMTPPLQ